MALSDEAIRFFEQLKTEGRRRRPPVLQPRLPGEAGPPIGLPEAFELGRPLREKVDDVAECASALLRIVGHPLSDQLATLLQDVKRTTTRIAVVGQIKAGKSSFINALIGRADFLPTHVNPWTAVPTMLYFGIGEQPQKGALFEFFGRREWDRLGKTLTAAVVGGAAEREPAGVDSTRTVWRRALVRLGERYHHLLDARHRYETISPEVLSHYLCAGPSIEQPSRHISPGRYADITRLAHVYLPARPFAFPTILIDTPGLNDPTIIRAKTTENILEYADAYIVILTARQPLSFTDIDLLRQLRGLEKRRFVVFINRIDELDGGLADVETVENHVRAKLRQEFPAATIPVISGSALWANVANAGKGTQLLEVAGSPAFGAIAARGAPIRIAEHTDALRAQIFEASGLPGLGRAVSQMMRDSFLTAQGANAISLLSSAAQVTASAARLELKTVREIAEPAKPVGHGLAIQAGIAQIERRLDALAAARQRVGELTRGAQDRIQTNCDDYSGRIGAMLQDEVARFGAEQHRQFLRQAREGRHTPSLWHCDTNGLVKRLENIFLELYSAAILEIAAVHDACLDQVTGLLEAPHATAGKTLLARNAAPPDVRHALPALGATINVGSSPFWRLRWWGGDKTPDDKASMLEAEILQKFAPVKERLVQLAARELSLVGASARSSIEASAAGAIDGAQARLQDLKTRLLHHEAVGHRPQAATVSQDYSNSITAMTNVIGQCEAVLTRLRRLGGGAGEDA